MNALIGNLASCNHEPFANDSECERSPADSPVDVRQFYDFPFCDVFSPSPPETPPEIHGTSIDVVIPPPCSCIDIDYEVKAVLGGTTGSDFSAVGDCCEGNYSAELTFALPCPFGEKDEDDGGEPEDDAKVTLEYCDDGDCCGASPSAECEYVNVIDCYAKMRPVDMKLCIPCPFTGAGTSTLTMSALVGSRKGLGLPDSADIASVSNQCSLSLPGAERILLCVSCPFYLRPYDKSHELSKPEEYRTSEKESKSHGKEVVQVSVEYGDGPRSMKLPFLSVHGVDSENKDLECLMEAASANFALQIPCPIEVDSSGGKEPGVVSGRIRYGHGKNKIAKHIVTSQGSGQTGGESGVNDYTPECNIEVENADFDLEIPCPIVGGGSLSVEVGYVPSKEWKGEDVRTNVIRSVGECSLVVENTHFNLALPCPVEKSENGVDEVAVSVSYGNGPSTAKGTYIEADGACHLSTKPLKLDLQLPCPVSDVDGRINASVSFGDGPSKVVKTFRIDNGQSASGGSSSCSLSVGAPDSESLDFDLQLPCPVTQGGSVTVGIGYGDGSTSASGDFATLGSNCDLEFHDVYLGVNIDCPIVTGSASITSSFSYEEDWHPTASGHFLSADCDDGLRVQDVDLPVSLQCPFSGSSTFTLNILAMSAGSKDDPQTSGEAVIAKKDGDCKVTFQDEEVTLLLPCPFPAEGSMGLEASVEFADAVYETGDTVIAEIGSSCAMTMRTGSIDLSLPCPFGQDSRASLSLGVCPITMGYENHAEVTVASAAGCNMDMNDGAIAYVYLDCPTFMAKYECSKAKTGSFVKNGKWDGESEYCNADYTFVMTFPEGEKGDSGEPGADGNNAEGSRGPNGRGITSVYCDDYQICFNVGNQGQCFSGINREKFQGSAGASGKDGVYIEGFSRRWYDDEVTIGSSFWVGIAFTDGKTKNFTLSFQ